MGKRILLLFALLSCASVQADSRMPQDAIAEPNELRFAHASGERMHERWRVEFEFDWQRGRERLIELVCGIGYVATAIIDCGWTAAVQETGPERFEPPKVLDLDDINRRPVNARMRSI